MNGQFLSFAFTSRRPNLPVSRLPASYRAHAVQQDVRGASGVTRAQYHFIATSKEIARSNRGERSVGVAVILALLLGPVGMLYASELGAFVMATIDCIALSLSRISDLFILWGIGAIWAALSVVASNRDTEETS